MSKQLKNLISRDLKRRIGRLEGYVLVDFRGLNNAQTFDLRRALHGAGVQMRVVQNRLAARELDRWNGQSKEFRALFRGPTAVVFDAEGALSASKVLVQWKKKNKDVLSIKGGVVQGQILPPSDVEALAKLPGRQQLLAQLAGTFQAPVARLASATQGILARVVYALEAYRRQLEELRKEDVGSPQVEQGGDAAAAAPAS